MRWLGRFLELRSPQKVCVRAFEIYLEVLLADEVVRRLRKEGFSEHLAARAVTFLPSAFAREYYLQQGLSFPEYFYPGAAACRSGKKIRYADDRVFGAAVSLAAQLTRDGDWSQVWRFIEISAEHAVVTQAKAQGLTPKSFEMFIHEF
jgi:hypothetical protein